MSLDRISVRLIITFFAFTLLILSATGYFALVIYEQGIEEDTQAHLNTSIAMKRQLMRAWISSSVKEAERIAGHLERFNASVTGSERMNMSNPQWLSLQEYLENSARESSLISTVEVADRRGRIIASNNPHNLAKNISLRPYFNPGLKDTSVTGLYYAPSAREYRITITTPVPNNSNARMLLAHLNMSVLDDIMSHPSSPAKTEETYLVDERRFLVTELSSSQGLVKRLDSEGIRQALLGKHQGAGRYENYAGIQVFGAYQWLEEFDAAMIDEIQVEEALQPLSVLKRRLLGIGSILVLLGLLGVFLISTSITRPLTHLLRGVESAKRQRAYTLVPSGPLETRLLAERFNELTEEVGRVLDELRASHLQFKAIASSIDMGLLLFDAQMNMMYHNRWVMEHAIQKTGTHCYELLWNRGSMCDECPVKRALGTGEVEQVTRSPQSGEGYFCITAYPITERGGRVIGAVETIRDVSHEKQTEEQLHREKNRLSVLLDVSAELNAERSCLGVYDSIVHAARDVLKVDCAVLMMQENEHLVVVNALGFSQSSEHLLRIPPGTGLCSHVVKLKKPDVTPDLSREMRFKIPEVLVREGVVSIAAAPLLWDGKVIGVLSVHTRKKRVFLPEELDLLQTLSNYASAAIKRIEQYEAELRRAEQVESLLKTSEIINSKLDEQSVLLHLLEAAVNITDSRAGGAGFYEKGAFRVHQYYREGTWIPLDYSFRAGEGVPGWVIRHRKPYISLDARSDPHTIPEIVEELGFTKILSVPVISSEGELLAILEVHDKRKGDFTDTDAHLLSSLANHAAIAITKARSMRELMNKQRRLELLHRAAQTLRAEDLKEGVEDCLSLIIDFFGYHSGHLRRFDETTGKLVIVAQVNMNPVWVAENQIIELGECGCGYAALNKKTLISEQPSKDARITKQECKEDKLICTPLLLEEKLVGVMRFTGNTTHVFEEDEVELLELLGSEIARYIDNALLHEQVERMQQWLSLMMDATGHTAKQRLLSEVARRITQTLGAHRCLIYLKDAGGFMLSEEYSLTWRIKNTPHMNRAAAFHRALLHRKPVVFNDAQDENTPLLQAFSRTIQDLDIHSFIALPLWYGDVEQDLIVVHDCEAVRIWNRWDVEMLTCITGLVSLKLQLFEQADALEKQRFTAERVEEEHARVVEELREQTSLINSATLSMLSTRDEGVEGRGGKACRVEVS